MTTSENHQRMTDKRKAGYDKKQARATVEKGLLIVNTGTGKGKSSAAFGMAVRGVGHDMKVGVVQFIKGAMDTGERRVLGQFEQVSFHSIGDGFTWHTQNRAQDIQTAGKAWAIAREMIKSDAWDMVILDELNVILKYEYLDLQEILQTLKQRPPMQHVIITGRHAPEALIEQADLVSEIRAIKHPYREQGVKAQKGIEF